MDTPSGPPPFLERPVLLYDGDCGFCASSARFAADRIGTGARLLPYQETDLPSLGTTEARASREVVWVGRDRRTLGGARAVAALLVDAGGPWRALGLAIAAPPVVQVAEAVYRLVSANRHRLPGGTPVCSLPQERRPGAR